MVILSLLVGCGQPTPRKPIAKQKSESLIERSIRYSKKLYAMEHRQFQQYFLEQNLRNIQQSKFGYGYRTIQTNPKAKNSPKIGNTVKLEGSITNLNQEVLYTFSKDKPLQFKVDKQDQVLGLHQAVKLMKKNEEFEFYFLSYHTFGYHGDNDKIKPMTPLIYRLKLISFK